MIDAWDRYRIIEDYVYHLLTKEAMAQDLIESGMAADIVMAFINEFTKEFPDAKRD